MDKLRLVTLAVLIVAAVVVACSEIESPTDIVAAASITQGEACAEWSCDEFECGHPTSPPYHACCVRSIYDPPCSYQSPCPEVDEPLCVPCVGCDLQDNSCFFSGNTCHFDEGFPCPLCCEEEEGSCCQDDPTSQGDCEERDYYLYYYGYPTYYSPGEYCSGHPFECMDYCAEGHF